MAKQRENLKDFYSHANAKKTDFTVQMYRISHMKSQQLGTMVVCSEKETEGRT